MATTERFIVLLICLPLYSVAVAQSTHDSILCNVVTKTGGRAVPVESLKFDVRIDGRKASNIRVAQTARARRIMLIQDISGSMRSGSARELSSEAIKEFAKSASAADQLALVDFNDQYYLDITPRGAAPFLEKYADPSFQNKMTPRGGTALFDAVVASESYIEQEPQEGDSLVIISDGADDASRLGSQGLRSQLFGSRIRVYLLKLAAPGPEYMHGIRGPSELIDTLRGTGGFVADAVPNKLRESVETIHNLIADTDKIDFDLDAPVAEPARLNVTVSNAQGKHDKAVETLCPRYLGPEKP
jgi:hypothetical protein